MVTYAVLEVIPPALNVRETLPRPASDAGMSTLI
jgi:hypothetical protein